MSIKYHTQYDQQIAKALIKTLMERIEEGENTSEWIEHETVISDARKIVANAHNK